LGWRTVQEGHIRTSRRNAILKKREKYTTKKDQTLRVCWPLPTKFPLRPSLHRNAMHASVLKLTCLRPKGLSRPRFRFFFVFFWFHASLGAGKPASHHTYTMRTEFSKHTTKHTTHRSFLHTVSRKSHLVPSLPCAQKKIKRKLRFGKCFRGVVEGRKKWQRLGRGGG
jgi:hypothetical protein